jgi:hypothetical protein
MLMNSSRPENWTRMTSTFSLLPFVFLSIVGCALRELNGDWETRTSEAVPNPQRFSGASSTPTGSTLRNAPERRNFPRELA